jgi:HAD superfamily hydrolase (TIGR01509 family)
LVLFDLGGTLIEEREYADWAEAARRWGLDLGEEPLARAYSEIQRETDVPPRRPTTAEFWQKVLSRALESPVGLPVAEQFVAYWHEHPSAPRLFSDARGCLERLQRERRRMGVISNSRSEASIRDKMRQTGILDFFEVVLSSGTEGVEKPDPEIFRRGLRRSGVPPSEAFYVGDLEYTDAKAARAAGLRSVWLNRDGTGMGDEPEITSLTELPFHLAKIEVAGRVK